MKGYIWYIMNENNLEKIVNIEQFKKIAERILPRNILSFIAGGSGKEITLHRNVEQYNKYFIVPKVLRNISKVDMSTTVLGEFVDLPIFIAPTAYHRLVSDKGEIDTVNALNNFNSIMILSLFSTTSYEELINISKNPLWMQIYFFKDRFITKNIIEYIEQLGFKAIVITVDTPVYAKRVREQSFPLKFNKNINFKYLKKFGIDIDNIMKSKKHFSELLDHNISWNDIEWLTTISRLPIILKGVLHHEDTSIASEIDSIKGIIISNHGGRQLDSSVSPLDVLKLNKLKIRKNQLLLIDGGISCGQDIFKSIALGAHAVLIGKPILWGLVAGENGVLRVINIIKKELEETMILSGTSSLSEINEDFLLRVEKGI